VNELLVQEAHSGIRVHVYNSTFLYMKMLRVLISLRPLQEPVETGGEGRGHEYALCV